MDHVKRNIVITGTGRTGTTLLINLLTHLGFDTGFKPEEISSLIDEVSRGGLEHRVGEASGPYIVKDPAFMDYASEVLDRKDILIEHVFIPMREIEAAASSRRANQKEHFNKLSIRTKLQYLRNPYPLHGGLLLTSSLKRGVQEEVLMEKLYGLLLTLSKHQIPVTFVQFPYLITHPMYLYEKLAPILKDVPYASFLKVFERLVDPSIPGGLDSEK